MKVSILSRWSLSPTTRYRARKYQYNFLANSFFRNCASRLSLGFFLQYWCKERATASNCLAVMLSRSRQRSPASSHFSYLWWLWLVLRELGVKLSLFFLPFLAVICLESMWYSLIFSPRTFISNAIIYYNTRKALSTQELESESIQQSISRNRFFKGIAHSIRKFNFNFNYKSRPIFLQAQTACPKMKAMKMTKDLIKTFDLFSISQFLRYRDEEQYKTVSGGTCSLMVVTVFMVLFMNTALQTINMTNIGWTSSTSFVFDPSETQFSISPPTNSFMFAVGIIGVNLNHPSKRFFDVSMIDHHIKRGNVEVSSSTVDLVPCTVQHFSINEQIKSSFSSLPTFRWLCPPLGYSFGLHGKYTSESMEQLEITVKKCNDTLDPSRPCVPQSTIADLQTMLGQFTLSYFYINPLINPGNHDYLNYYLQDRNYISFTRQLGAYSNGFVEDFEIDTDVSLLPFSDNVVEMGTIITELFQNIVYQVTGDSYASFYIMKSSRSTTYSRSFTKVDSFFSYVGGLVGTILGLMLLVTKYSQFAFQLQMSQRLFWYKVNQPNDFKNASIFHYTIYLFYCLFRWTKPCKNWKRMQEYYSSREEMVKQLNIELILTKIGFLENAVEAMFSENQLQGLYLQRFDTLEKVKKRRRRYRLKDKYRGDEGFSEDSESSSQDSKSHTNKQIDLNNSTFKLKDDFTKNMESAFEQIDKQEVVFQPKEKGKQEKDKEVDLSELRKESEFGNAISLKILNGVIESISERKSSLHIPKKESALVTSQVKVEKKATELEDFHFLN